MKKFLLASSLSIALATSLYAEVLAKAGNIEVTSSDLAPILEQASMNGDKNITKEEKKKIVENLLKYKLLLNKVKSSGIENSPEYKKQVELATDSIAFGLWQKKQFEDTKVSEAEIKKYYEDHKKDFLKPAEVKAQHILVKTEAEAKAIIAELEKTNPKNLEAEFTKLAKEKSIDPTAKKNGGEIGWFNKNMMVESFANAAFALKDKEFTKTPVKSQFGYHIIYKQASKPASEIPFDKVKDIIKMRLKQEKFQKDLENQANELYKAQKVEFFLK